RSLIPAAWTDLKNSGAAVTAPPARAMLAALTDLLQARTVADALLRRLPTSGEVPSPAGAEEEGHRATEPDDSRARRPRSPRVGRTDAGAACRRDRDPRSPVRQGGRRGAARRGAAR